MDATQPIPVFFPTHHSSLGAAHDNPLPRVRRGNRVQQETRRVRASEASYQSTYSVEEAVVEVEQDIQSYSQYSRVLSRLRVIFLVEKNNRYTHSVTGRRHRHRR